MTLAAPTSVQAQETALERRVTVQFSGVSLREALDRVAAAAHLRLTYVSELLPLERPARSGGDTVTVAELLGNLLAGVSVKAVAAGPNQIVLAPSLVPMRPSLAAVEQMLPTTALDRAVVTGTADGGSRRGLSVSLSVVGREELARSGATSFAGALDGGVPGVWAWDQGASGIIARYASIRGASTLGASYLKVYIDGISVANPLLITSIEPEAVERIEVIRGPQGAALYGADAISGVVNIVTRHENQAGAAPKVRLRSIGGVSSSAYATPGIVQDHHLSLGGGSALRSGQIGVGLASIGEFYEHTASQRISANGAFREVGARALITGSARFIASSAGVPATTTIPTTAIVSDNATGIVSGKVTGMFSDNATTQTSTTEPTNADEALTAYTAGVTARMSGGARWTHTLVAGVDGYRLRNYANEFTPFPSSADSALRAARGGADRTTARATSSLRLGDDRRLGATASVSLEQSTLRQESPVIHFGGARLGDSIAKSLSSPVDWFHDLGATTQVDVAVRERLYLTAGLRLERNDGYLSGPRTSTLPMLGATFVTDVGPVTLKWRAAFGRGMRAPRTAARETTLGGISSKSSRSDLNPERQTGIEGGFDLYAGSALTLQVTAFDQLASGLIQQVVVPDSTVTAQGQQPTYLSFEYQNVGAITNRGWEAQATARRGPLALSASYAAVRSRVRTVATHYTGDLRAGDRVLGVPAQTVAASLAWTANRWSASLGVSRAFDWIEYDRMSIAEAYTRFERREVPLFGSDLRGYWRKYDGNTHLRASLSRTFSRGVTGLLTGENLLGQQRGEPDNATIVPGRTISTGLRLSFF